MFAKKNNIKLVVGLGNPGAKYENTRHNIGFVLIDELAKKLGLELKNEKKFSAEFAQAEISINYKIKGDKETLNVACKIILVKPQTFMNDSGKAVVKFMQFYKIKPEDMLIIHDDVSLDTAKLRMAFNRGAGGQHGIEDTIEKLGGNKAFHRLKFGVGPDPGGDQRSDYVLGKFPKEQEALLKQASEQALLMIQAWLLGEDFQRIEEIKLAC